MKIEKVIITSILFVFGIFSHSISQENTVYEQLIPIPVQIKSNGGSCNVWRKLVTDYNPNIDIVHLHAHELLEAICTEHNQTLNEEQEREPLKVVICFTKKKRRTPIGTYHLNIQPNQIEISAGDEEGLFNGMASLRQLFLLSSLGENQYWPCATIHDYPKFAWRGMHLDVGRHFFPVPFIKKYLDLMSLYKMNVFHWHLTEDQGWRIEIKKYPKLTEVGAWRSGTMVGAYDNQEYDSVRYGGFYTQEEIKEIVAYAAARNITVVPEIEMPGHALAALAAYPEYSCNGGPFKVARGWGVFDDVFCTKESTFTFIEDILSEVLDLFPSTYIHIGGDECPKTRWKTCAHCQQNIKKHKLKDEHELQSYFIRRIEQFLNSRGRKLIGWDEILEGGLAPGAAVMSWRGTEGGIAAANQKHQVVMTPGSHCYFDHYQGNPRYEPHAIGGYTTLEKVYQFQPIPKDLKKRRHKYILGAQGNVWTEYMKTEAHLEYMVLPRLLALSEVLWGTANPQQYHTFFDRVVLHAQEILETFDYNFSKAMYQVDFNTFSINETLHFKLSATDAKGLLYQLNDGEWQTYQESVALTSSTKIAFRYENEKVQSPTYEQNISINLATGKRIELVHEPNAHYNHGGSFALVNGIEAHNGVFGKDWLGFSGQDLIATIDLGTTKNVQSLGINLLERKGSWIFYPKNLTFEYSDDGQNYTSAETLNYEYISQNNGRIRIKMPAQVKARYFRVTAKNYGIIGEGLPGAGAKAWLFADEVLVE
jgi:hexosaminidase